MTKIRLFYHKPAMRITALMLCLFMLLVIIPSFLLAGAEGKEDSKVVRVGWYESVFNLTDRNDKRSGYAYDYQLKISAYTGWTYEYVTGSWPELYGMLLEGKIDMLSDVSLTPERQEQLLFSSLPMGSEEYYACVSSRQNAGVTAEDLSIFNGKKIGVNGGTYQEELLREWLERNRIDAEITELSGTQFESIEMLHNGEIDVLVDLDVYGLAEDVSPVCAIGSSDIYFAVTQSRPDLVNELNSAMARIREENRNYNQHLQEKYFNANLVNLDFSHNEVDWIASHGAVRVGYQNHYLAFCSQNEENGELTGALSEYLSLASGCMRNAVVVFEPIPFENVEEAFTALRKGEIDCVFPVNLSSYEAEQRGASQNRADHADGSLCGGEIGQTSSIYD